MRDSQLLDVLAKLARLLKLVNVEIVALKDDGRP